MKPLLFASRSLRREFRHGELATLAAALVLAVAALTAVGTLASRVENAILASAAELLGGDLGVSARRTALPEEFSSKAAEFGLASSRSVEFSSVVFAGENSQFIEVRAVDASFPLRGKLLVSDADGVPHAASAPTPGEVFADRAVLNGLAVGVGDTLQLAGRDLRIGGEIISAPGGAVFQFAPTQLMNRDDAETSGLLGQGSRATYRVLVSGDGDSIERYAAWAKDNLPPAARLTTVADAQANLRNSFERGENFLRLAALLAALLAGIAVALAAQRFARRKTEEVAVLRCLGASRNEIILSLISELVLLALPACAIGALIGLGLQQIAFLFAGQLLGGATPALGFGPALSAFVIGLAVLLGFALPPLLRLRDIEPMRVFRRDVHTRLRRFDALYALPLVVGGILILIESGSTQLAGVLAAGLIAVAVATVAVTLLLLKILRGSSRRIPGALRFGLANLSRRRGLTLIQVGAFALSLTALDLLAVVGPSLLDRWRADLPVDTPNYFVLNLQADQRERFETRLKALGADNMSLLPLAAGKLVAINGKPLQASDYEEGSSAGNRVEGEVRVSWSKDLPPSNRVVEGSWTRSDAESAELSIDKSWVEMFKVGLGDSMSLRFGDQEISATISSVREVDWDSFRVNFFLMLDPKHGEPLPHSLISSFHVPPDTQLASLSREMPNLSLIDVNAILDRVRDIISRVSAAVTWVLGFSLVAGILVLLAALAATADERRFEIALLRTLGANSRQLNIAVLGEFAVLGLLAGAVAAFGAAGTGIALARTVFRMSDYWPPITQLLLISLASAVVVMLAGLAGTRRIARTPPMQVLRHGA
ncbi:MAG TPA: FtsX-like permease family protein [Dokdonella sp.]|uniref:ABC transporter permease n=1 Tax=Dokdonella sp. TaxID=2291710 RepID=UPI002D7EF4BF|nr:FtsX-like permease family protein [Dokdonella sp.]HET9032412.1 FtsX-like permease family protein [Dokdonella sp.]